MKNVGWACEFDCFGPHATIHPPGMIEIKAEELCAVVCATPDAVRRMGTSFWLACHEHQPYALFVAQKE